MRLALAAAGPDMQALRASPAAREAVDRLVQLRLKAAHLTLADLDEEGYLARYREAEAELYPESYR